ncbi:12276_t:CDS:2, partial [Cetraspora pellucida]
VNDLREKWNELTESQVFGCQFEYFISWDPSTACFARGPEGILVRLALLAVPGDPSTACFACGPGYLVVEFEYRDPSTACFACGPLKFFKSIPAGITFYYFMDNLRKDLEHHMEAVLDE